MYVSVLRRSYIREQVLSYLTGTRQGIPERNVQDCEAQVEIHEVEVLVRRTGEEISCEY